MFYPPSFFAVKLDLHRSSNPALESTGPVQHWIVTVIRQTVFRFQYNVVIPASNLVQLLDRKSIFRSSVYSHQHNIPTLLESCRRLDNQCWLKRSTVHSLPRRFTNDFPVLRLLKEDWNTLDMDRFSVKELERNRMIQELDWCKPSFNVSVFLSLLVYFPFPSLYATLPRFEDRSHSIHCATSVANNHAPDTGFLTLFCVSFFSSSFLVGTLRFVLKRRCRRRPTHASYHFLASRVFALPCFSFDRTSDVEQWVWRPSNCDVSSRFLFYHVRSIYVSFAFYRETSILFRVRRCTYARTYGITFYRFRFEHSALAFRLTFFRRRIVPTLDYRPTFYLTYHLLSLYSFIYLLIFLIIGYFRTPSNYRILNFIWYLNNSC